MKATTRTSAAVLGARQVFAHLGAVPNLTRVDVYTCSGRSPKPSGLGR